MVYFSLVKNKIMKALLVLLPAKQLPNNAYIEQANLLKNAVRILSK